MAREKALNIGLVSDSINDDLAHILDGVIENIQTSAVSEALKNKEGSGDPVAGSVEYKRFVNASLEDKGTARAGTPASVVASPVIVNLDINKEIVEEIQNKDIKLYGITDMVGRRAGNHTKRFTAFLDRAFFTEAINGKDAYDVTGLSTEKEIIDAMIVSAKETESNFIDGIDADDLALVVNGTYRKALKNELDKLPEGTDAKNGLIGRYDGVDVYETHRLPSGTNAIVMLKGAVAQPYFVSEYRAEKIPLDDAIAVQSFLYVGAKQLTPEAIYVTKDAGSQ